MKSNLPITAVSGIGEVRARAFYKLGIKSVTDLIYHFPRAYENRGNVRLLANACINEKSAFLLTVASEPQVRLIRKGMSLVKFRAFDESASVEITYYNQNFLKDIFHIGAAFRFFGKLERTGRRFCMSAPSFEPYVEGKELPPFFPVYPLTDGLSQKLVSSAIKEALKISPSSTADFLPEQIRRENGLCVLKYALENIHSPEDAEALSIAKRRLIFDEFFLYSIGLELCGKKRKKEIAFACPDTDMSDLLSLLPYSLTAAQNRVIGEVLSDMSKNVPMSRIIVGDVGCGKTICAAAAIFAAVKSGMQAALMVPTEILASQHYNDLSAIFEKLGYKCALLVGSVSAAGKKKLYSLIASPNKDERIDIVIGTQALIQDKLDFFKLGLIVTDEQHRFGVMQRSLLSEKNENAHVLVMSATPIPRTLALALYGDLDISLIDEMPAGRKRVDTYALDESYRERINRFIRKNVEDGGQVYIVCPSVDEIEAEAESGEIPMSDIEFGFEQKAEPELKSAIKYAEELQNKIFPDFSVAFVHGKMKGAEKDSVMQNFALGKINILVSTTVIEVGVNVPNASLMIVENAERFGLSQLHQLRGRVGRGERKSYCILMSESKSEKARKRLDIMRTMYDGYLIAEKDLEMRGPGDFVSMYGSDGVRQHGSVNFKLADICNDTELMKSAVDSAKRLFAGDPGLELPDNIPLKEKAENLFSEKLSTVN